MICHTHAAFIAVFHGPALSSTGGYERKVSASLVPLYGVSMLLMLLLPLPTSICNVQKISDVCKGILNYKSLSVLNKS